jgi:hypothetical protein
MGKKSAEGSRVCSGANNLLLPATDVLTDIGWMEAYWGNLGTQDAQFMVQKYPPQSMHPTDVRCILMS